MKVNVVPLAFLLALGAFQAGAHAGTTDVLQDALFNVNGSVTDGFSVPGLDTSSFNTTTGEGTLVFTFNPGAAGSYFFDSWFDNTLNTPFFNEYGAVSGTAAVGQSWEIGDAQLYYNYPGPTFPAPPGTDIGDNTWDNTLSDANELPGDADNYLNDCTAGSSCNGDASMAMGFAFSLAANQFETITLNLSETAPNSGFYLQQIHPADPNNLSQLNLYFTGSAVTGSGGPPPPTPEPSTWILVSSVIAGFLLLRSKEFWRARLKAIRVGRVAGNFFLALLAVLLIAPRMAQAQITVKTVPWVPATPTLPHTTYAVCSNGTMPNYSVVPPSCTAPATLTEAAIRLGATVTLPNTTDTYTAVWNFGDGSPAFNFSVSNANLTNYDVSTTHQYPATAAAATAWTATLTVTDTKTSVQGSATYPVIQSPITGCPGTDCASNYLSAKVNVAIDNGLWFEHTSMWRGTTTVNSSTVNIGGWDDAGGEPCINSNICTSYGGLDANFVQAFEVNLHLENGPSSDPYTDDVARGLARMMAFLIPEAIASKSVTYNPAIAVDRCSDGTTPNFAVNPPTCTAPATLIQYNPGATSCTSPPCNITFDINHNGQWLYEGNDSGDPGYQVGMFVDAIVATNNPVGTAKAGPTTSDGLPGVYGQTYQNIVTDLVDGILYCQYGGDPYGGTSNGYDQGGGWSYYCATTNFEYDDNSISQWNAVGLIGAQRGFGISIPKIATDTNQVWVTYSQETNASEGCIGQVWNCTGIANNDSLVGAFGYYEYSYEPWGPFADTPSGMVQMDMDGVGITAAGAPDQRWNMAETFYHDNFCYNFNNSNTGYLSFQYDPLYYTYGMFSFTKAMLLYAPGGVLSPIKFLEDQPSGTNPIDWYGALSPANGGTSPCDGFAQTLVSRQASDGHWGNPSYNDENSTQADFETPWALIILKGSIVTPCITNLSGQGSPSTGVAKATIHITWSAQQNAVSYNVLRSTTNQGPYTQIGTTTSTAYADTSGLVNGDTYYYVVEPVNSGGSEICQSNQATVTIPKGR